MGGTYLGTGLLLALAATGCASQSAPTLLGQPVEKEVAVLVRMSDAAAEIDVSGGTAGLVDGVTRGLDERGMQNQVFAANDEHPPAPRIELWVEQWNAGAGTEQVGATVGTEVAGQAVAGVPGLGLVGAIAAAGEYSVLCRVYAKDGDPPVRVHRYTGMVFDTTPEDSPTQGERLGRRIVAEAFDNE
jgi:hypothetical protein